jgi:hypothetical protein
LPAAWTRPAWEVKYLCRLAFRLRGDSDVLLGFGSGWWAAIVPGVYLE